MVSATQRFEISTHEQRLSYTHKLMKRWCTDNVICIRLISQRRLKITDKLLVHQVQISDLEEDCINVL